MAGQSRAERNRALGTLIGEKLDVPGTDLGTVRARAGRLLPRGLRREADYLVELELLDAHPKLRHLVDHDRAKRAEAALKAHVRHRDPAKERADRRLGWLAGLVFGLLLYACLVVVVLYWRGFIGPGG